MENLYIEYLPVDDLIPYIKNARKHPEEQVNQIAASIREFGFVSPVLLKDDNTITAGHGRILAAKKLGLEKVPCIKLKHLTDTQIKAYTIIDNQLTLNSDWDNDLLKLEIQDLVSLDFNVDLLGFSEKEMKDLFKEFDADGSQELSEDDFDNFKNQCPKCGFEWNEDDKQSS